LSELSAFHAAARHLSFTQAAQELCVTQGAISRHIAGLEQFLGTVLFVRRPKGLELTHAGLTYVNATRPAMKQLETATAHLMSHRGMGGVLNLSVSPTFVIQWLFPRLGHFQQTLPDVALNFVRHEHLHDFSSSYELDAAIQFGTGEWPDAEAEYLTGRETSIVCSPTLRTTLGFADGYPDTEALTRATLLQHVEVPHAWKEWLIDNQIREDINGLFGPRFNQYSLIIRAAVSGVGVGIVPTCLIEEELKSGVLVEPLGRRYTGRDGYYLCATPEKSNLPAFRLFMTWVRDQVRAPEQEARELLGRAGSLPRPGRQPAAVKAAEPGRAKRRVPAPEVESSLRCVRHARPRWLFLDNVERAS
jgi:DNA-binding transcriptional LysR family regulator